MKRFVVFAAGVGVEHLRFVQRRECCQRHRLRLAAGEQRGAVRARQEADFRSQGAKLVEIAAVAALLRSRMLMRNAFFCR